MPPDTTTYLLLAAAAVAIFFPQAWATVKRFLPTPSLAPTDPRRAIADAIFTLSDYVRDDVKCPKLRKGCGDAVDQLGALLTYRGEEDE